MRPVEEDERLPTEQPEPSEPAGEQDPENEEERIDEDEGQDPLARVERERAEYLELAQRMQADFENYRKRAAKEAAQAGERAKAGLVRELLPVVDNLERALASAPEGDPLLDGVKLVHGELVAVLERSGVQGFDPSGETFDPTEHEALSTRSAEGTDSGVVLDVVEKGYRLNGAILRPARVIVSA
jgi:molecular chaperone GrpE